MHLVVTSRGLLQAAYGSDAFERLSPALMAYSEALGQKVAHELLTVDDAGSAAMLNVAPVSAGDAGSVAGAIRAARSAAGPVTSVLLVGGPDVIPFFSVENPVANDEDTEILTDNPYGCAEADERMYPAPDVPVGRVVGSRDGGLVRGRKS